MKIVFYYKLLFFKANQNLKEDIQMSHESPDLRPFQDVLPEIFEGVANLTTLRSFEQLLKRATIPGNHQRIMFAYSKALVVSIDMSARGERERDDDSLEQGTNLLDPTGVLAKLASEMVRAETKKGTRKSSGKEEKSLVETAGKKGRARIHIRPGR